MRRRHGAAHSTLKRGKQSRDSRKRRLREELRRRGAPPRSNQEIVESFTKAKPRVEQMGNMTRSNQEIVERENHHR